MNRQDIIAMAAKSGMKASIGRTVKEKGKADVYHPDVNALGKSVPVEWLEKFSALVIANDRERLAAGVELPEPVMDCTGAWNITADQLRDYGDRRAAAEREAIAQLFPQPHVEHCGTEIQAVIRARGGQQ